MYHIYDNNKKKMDFFNLKALQFIKYSFKEINCLNNDIKINDPSFYLKKVICYPPFIISLIFFIIDFLNSI